MRFVPTRVRAGSMGGSVLGPQEIQRYKCSVQPYGLSHPTFVLSMTPYYA